MREIYTSPRPENIDRVVALFARHGIKTRIRNRRVYDRPSYQRFSYGPREDRSSWAQVEVCFARDLPQARSLLKEIGVAPLTRYAEELDAVRNPQRRASPLATARRVRTVVLAALVATAFVMVMKMANLM